MLDMIATFFRGLLWSIGFCLVVVAAIVLCANLPRATSTACPSCECPR